MKDNDLIRKELSVEKLELMKKILNKDIKENDNNIFHINENTNQLLSYQQEQLWFLQQINPENTAYNEVVSYKLIGDIDYNAFVYSFNKIIEINPCLRTVFTNVDGEPRQSVLEDINYEVCLISLENVENSKQQKIVSKLSQDLIRRPINLSNWPLYHTLLVKLNSSEYIFIFIVHHIIFDAISEGIIIRELANIYNKVINKEEIDSKSNTTYIDYAAWQRKTMLPLYKKQYVYWKKRLSNIKPINIHSNCKNQDNGPAERISIHIDKNCSIKLKKLAHSYNMTLYSVFLAILNLTLYKLTRSTSICILTATACRNNLQLQDIVGYFSNSIVLKTDLCEDSTVEEMLLETKKNVLESLNNQEIPFSMVCKMVKENNLDISELSNVFFSFPNVSIEGTALSNIRIEKYNIERDSAKFNMLVELKENTTHIGGYLEYNSLAFDKVMMRSFVDTFIYISEQIVEDITIKVKELKAIRQIQEKRILYNFNNTKTFYNLETTISKIFENSVNRYSNKIALIENGKTITYCELDRLSNRVANKLVLMGAVVDSIIGIKMKRSVDMMVALLGILKSGAAYMPIAIDVPKKRFEYMIRDSNVSLVIVDSNETKELKNTSCNFVVYKNLVDHECEDELQLKVEGNNLLYVLYTSGTTGNPKGVLINNRTVINRLEWMNNQYDFNENDIFLQKTPNTFDVSVWELFGWFFRGASLVLLEHGTEADPVKIIETIRKRNVSIIHFVPCMLEVFLDIIEEKEISDLKTLRYIFASGEVLKSKLCKIHNEKLLKVNGTRLFNLYGPTEATVDVTHFDCSVVTEMNSIPIGKPIDNVEVYILDQYNNLLPIGFWGELCIAGEALARGYINEQEKTYQSFCNILIQGKIKRIYKTGDICRYLEDGNIEYKGRIDNQIKIHGVRIELGEIENSICNIEGVKHAAVITKENGNEKIIIAYVVSDISANEIKKKLAESLISQMLPSEIYCVDKMPLNQNGKIDRQKLINTRKPIQSAYSKNSNFIEKKIKDIWEDILDKTDISTEDNLFEIGGHSLVLPKIQSKINKTFNSKIQLQDLFKYPSIKKLAQHIMDDNQENEKYDNSICESGNTDIAIIGISCKFPGADNYKEYCENIRCGKESIHFFDEEELISAGISNNIVFNENYIRAKGIISDTDMFDNDFFNISAHEASLMDPQQRVFLEHCWHALEDAGYSKETYEYPVGIFGGSGYNAHILKLYLSMTESERNNQSFEALLANKSDFFTTRVSYKCNLTGPSYNVQTACSTSLVAVYMACESIINNECAMALAGAVSISTQQKEGYHYTRQGVMSPDGHCRPFDSKESGVVNSNGVGVVLLKKLSEAENDGDHIYAVIKGGATNNDGNDKVSFTAPSINGQCAVIDKAIETAGISKDSISYIETHGTGTDLGDMIEISALNDVFSQTERNNVLYIGSVKSNIGHTDNAAGMAGLLKTISMLREQMLYPSINCSEVNKKLDLKKSNIVVNRNLIKWESDKQPRRAGVSSFGIGGTNAHIILEEYNKERKSDNSTNNLFILSAKTKKALMQYIFQIKKFIIENDQINISDVCYTLMVGRCHFPYRYAFCCSNRDECINRLNSINVEKQIVEVKQKKKIAFVFDGVGNQYYGMIRDLYCSIKIFKKYFDKCLEIIASFVTKDIKYILMQASEKTFNDEMKDTKLQHLIIFSIEYALAKTLMENGITPDCMIGYSLGEIVAACISKVIDLENAIKFITKRAEILQQNQTGKMVVVCLGKEEINEYLIEGVDIAVENSNLSCVISGKKEQVDKLLYKFEQKNIIFKELNVNNPMHSKILCRQSIDVQNCIKDVPLFEPSIPYVNNMTAKYINYKDIKGENYWGNHICNTVRFSEGIKMLLDDNVDIFIEIGIGNGLCGFIQQNNILLKKSISTISTLRNSIDNTSDISIFYEAIKRLYLKGCKINWEKFNSSGNYKRISLPTYPYQKSLFEIRSGENSSECKDNVKNLYYILDWKQLEDENNEESEDGIWFIFYKNENEIVKKIIENLKHKDKEIINVLFNESGLSHQEEYVINNESVENYKILIPLLKDTKSINIIDLTCIERLSASHESILKHYLNLSKFISKYVYVNVNLRVFVRNLYDLRGDEFINLEISTVSGALRVMSQELQNVKYQIFDLQENSKIQIEKMLYMQCKNCELAIRGKKIWEKTYVPYFSKSINKLNRTGVFVIIGGLGKMGRMVAKAYSRENCRIIIIGKTKLNAGENIFQDEAPIIKEKMQILEELKGNKAEIEYISADVTDFNQMNTAIQSILCKYSKINGIVFAAGTVVQSVIQDTKIEVIKKQFYTKKVGLEVLEKVINNIDIDFCIVFSSLSAVMGGLGFFMYAAANNYIDAFVHKHNQQYDNLWISIDWDSSASINEVIEAFRVFPSIKNVSNVICTFENLNCQIEKWVKKIDSKSDIIDTGLKTLDRSYISTDYIKPEGVAEENVVLIWEEILKIKGIGVNDNFFELGGESLLAIKMLARLKKIFKIDISIVDVINNPTIGQLLNYIESRVIEEYEQ